MTGVAPGWYKDPAEPSTQRYWDGEDWVGRAIPADTPAPDGPPPVGPGPIPAGVAIKSVPPAAAPTAPATVPGPMVPPTAPPPAAGPTVPPIVPVQPTGASPAPPGWALGMPMRVRPHGHPLASLWARFLARGVDFLAVLGLNVVVNGWFIYQWWNEMYPVVAEMFRRVNAGQSTDDIAQPPRANSLLLIILLLAAALWFAYEVPAVAGSGQTPGKRLLQIKVMRLDTADPVGFGRAIRRWNPLGLPTLLWTCFGIGFVLQLIDCLSPTLDRPLYRALHDKSAGTVVVQTRPPNGGES